MTPRQARRERREAERKAKKLEFKKSRLAENYPLAAVAAGQPSGIGSTVAGCSTEPGRQQRSASPGALLDNDFPEIQPRWNPELENEFPREIQIRNNAIADRISLRASLPIPPPGPSPTFNSIEDVGQHLLAGRNAAQAPPAPANKNGFVSQNAPTRAEINRANAQHSTGPRTSEGKLASSRNSTRHGLASGQVLLPGEDPTAFEALVNSLIEEHQPATPAERILIEEMAQSHWLAQRALCLQNSCFTEEGINEKQLALFLRYQTTHQRAFYKAFNSLQQMKKTVASAARGFVSQQRSTTSPAIGFVSQNDPNFPRSPEFVRKTAPNRTPTAPRKRENRPPEPSTVRPPHA